MLQNCDLVKLGDILAESKDEVATPDPKKRIRVRLNVQGVERRPETNDVEGATKYFIRRRGQFIYGKQNLFKGAFGVIPLELDGFESSSDLPAFDVDESCNPEWIYYYLRHGKFYEELVTLAAGTGSRRVQPKKLYDLTIPLPERKVQDALICSFKAFETKQKGLDASIREIQANIHNLRRAILQEAVSGKLVPQDPNDEPATELLKRIKANKDDLIREGRIRKEKDLPPITDKEIPYELPQRWKWIRTGDLLASFDYGTSQKSLDITEGIPVVSMGNVVGGRLNLLNLKRISRDSEDLPKLLLRRNDILFNRTNSLELVGKAGIYEGENDQFTFASYLIRIRIFDYVHPKYLNYYLASRTFRETQIDPEVVQQCGQANFNGTKLRKTLFPLPPLQEQKRIAEKVEQLTKVCDELEGKNNENLDNSEILMEAMLNEAFAS
jgi:type I restriction enzyme S subunit